MKLKTMILALFLSLILVACETDDKGGNSSAQQGALLFLLAGTSNNFNESCSQSAFGKCTNVYGTTSFSDCAGVSGVLSVSACTASSAVGTCLLSDGKREVVYYSTTFTESTAQFQCDASSGTFSAGYSVKTSL